jgi:hypothetical protein
VLSIQCKLKIHVREIYEKQEFKEAKGINSTWRNQSEATWLAKLQQKKGKTKLF